MSSNRFGGVHSWSVRALRHGATRRRPARVPTIEALEGRLTLSTIAVTGPGDSGAGTLRAAIEQANIDPDQDTITFDPRSGGRSPC